MRGDSGTAAQTLVYTAEMYNYGKETRASYDRTRLLRSQRWNTYPGPRRDDPTAWKLAVMHLAAKPFCEIDWDSVGWHTELRTVRGLAEALFGWLV